MTDDKPQYAQGGFVPSGSVPFQLSPGCALMSLSSYRALGPKGLKELFPNTQFELVITADEARELGGAALDELLRELND